MVVSLTEEINLKDNLINNQETKILQINDQIKVKEVELKTQYSNIFTLNNLLQQKENELKSQLTTIIKLNNQLKEKDQLTQNYNEIIIMLNEKLKEKDSVIDKLTDDLRKLTDNLQIDSPLGLPTEVMSITEFKKYHIDIDDITFFKKSPSQQEPEVNLVLDLLEISKIDTNFTALSLHFLNSHKIKVTNIFQSLVVNEVTVTKADCNVLQNDLLALRLFTLENPKINNEVNVLLRNCISENLKVRKEAIDKLKRWKSFIYHLQTSIINLVGTTSKLTVWKGQSVNPTGIDNWKPNDVVIWPVFTCCSFVSSVGIKFAKGYVLFEIELDSNQGALLSEFSVLPSERDILLPAFSQFIIKSIKRTNSVQYHIQMTYHSNSMFEAFKRSSEAKYESDSWIVSISSDMVNIGNLVGKGSYGGVFEGNMKVALKAIPTFKKAEFQHEISIISQLKSPYLVHTYGAFLKDNFYIVMEYLEKTLTNYLKDNKQHQTEQPQKKISYQIGIDVASGLKYLHDHHIVHADLKSPNILLTKENRAKICDFGASKLKSLSSMTLAGPRIAGTNGYQAPEMFEKGASTDKRTDMFSLGMVFWELVSFSIPFEDCLSPSQVHTEMMSKFASYLPLLPIPAHAHPRLKRWILACWKLNPEERPLISDICEDLKRDTVL
eukprot:TRINITY_DN6423_c0_g1_i2.p1 TRINITY_DN6423_c0_g1~~TRINITY_DN6423_c0_g1_i2.p1  ORF type:complete len:664 (+),score=178.82 TRINITY_DN6423_c0_g1_i2:443-2434(+)